MSFGMLNCNLGVCSSLAEGYQEAAELFQSEASVEPGETASTLQERMEIREAIRSGKIENAVQMINSNFPGLLMSNDELRFQLQARIQTVQTIDNYGKYSLDLSLIHI